VGLLPDEVRARAAAYTREWRKRNPDYKPRKNAARRARYATDAAYRDAVKHKSLTYYRGSKKESETEKYLADEVEFRGGLCIKFVDPGRRGAPDRIVVLPGKAAVFVELKRERGGRVKPWQASYHRDLRARGQRVDVLWSKQDVDAFITSI
jgi:hypothetical protein